MEQELPEISPRELAARLQNGETFTILDVRDPWELTLAHLDDSRVLNITMNRIARERQEAFPSALRAPESDFVVICHHGVRSANVARWMLQNGWTRVSSLAGGLAAYAQDVDPGVGTY